MGAFSLNLNCDYKSTTCINCGVDIVLRRDYYDKRLSDRVDFYCPNGHAQHFIAETEAQKLQKLLDTERRWREQERERSAELERKLVATKGVVTRIKNRIAHGVCPCCNRTFQNVARHMKTKHPEYVGDTTRDA